MMVAQNAVRICEACDQGENRAGGCTWVRQWLCTNCGELQLHDLCANGIMPWIPTVPDGEMAVRLCGRPATIIKDGPGRLLRLVDHLGVTVFETSTKGTFFAHQYRAPEVKAMFLQLGKLNQGAA